MWGEAFPAQWNAFRSLLDLSTRRVHTVVVTGSAGNGKTRFLKDFFRQSARGSTNKTFSVKWIDSNLQIATELAIRNSSDPARNVTPGLVLDRFSEWMLQEAHAYMDFGIEVRDLYSPMRILFSEIGQHFSAMIMNEIQKANEWISKVPLDILSFVVIMVVEDSSHLPSFYWDKVGLKRSHIVTLPRPNCRARRTILQHLLRKYGSRGERLEPEDCELIASVASSMTAGYVMQNLQSLARNVWLRLRLESWEAEAMNSEQYMRTVVLDAMEDISATRMFETMTDAGPSGEGFSGVFGCDDAKKALQQCIEWPLTMNNHLQKMKITAPSGVLLYGPSGCGKTMLAERISEEFGVNVIRIRGPELLEKYVGESERKIRRLFEMARRASPSVLFFDDFEGIAMNRSVTGCETSGGVAERVLSTMLNEMDGIESVGSVFLVACSSRPDLIDPALLRPGRLEKHVYVGPMERQARVKLLVQLSQEMCFDVADVVDLVEYSNGFTGAEVVSFCREAAGQGIQRCLDNDVEIKEAKIALEDFRAAFDRKREWTCSREGWDALYLPFKQSVDGF